MTRAILISRSAAVFVKHFLLNGKWVETRLLVRHADGEWAGYSYEWNEAESDAALLASGKVRSVGGQRLDLSQPRPVPAMPYGRRRALPGNGDPAAQPFLSLSRQRAAAANQLPTYDHIGLLSAPLSAPVEQLPALPRSTDASQALGARARSYLHVNCSNCHRPGGTGRGEMDLRFDTALPAMNICDAVPLLGDLGIADARILAARRARPLGPDPAPEAAGRVSHAADRRRAARQRRNPAAGELGRGAGRLPVAMPATVSPPPLTSPPPLR